MAFLVIRVRRPANATLLVRVQPVQVRIPLASNSLLLTRQRSDLSNAS